MYMHPGSDAAGYIGRLLRYTDNPVCEDSLPVKADAVVFRKCLRSVIRQIKLYEGFVEKDGRQVSKRFYDEREWRWVPYVTEDENTDLLSLSRNTYDSLRARQAYEKASDAAGLTFEPEDIDYIIVSQESEILKVIGSVEKFGQRYDENTVKILSTRIISAERIRSDF
jgi:hypothetical protein